VRPASNAFGLPSVQRVTNSLGAQTESLCSGYAADVRSARPFTTKWRTLVKNWSNKIPRDHAPSLERSPRRLVNVLACNAAPAPNFTCAFGDTFANGLSSPRRVCDRTGIFRRSRSTIGVFFDCFRHRSPERDGVPKSKELARYLASSRLLLTF